MTVDKSSERKTSQRTEVVLRVEYRQPRDILSDYITSLGEGGMFIHTSLPLAQGQEITFTLSFPGLLDPFELRGVVRWRQTDEDPEEPQGLGVEFLFTDDDQKRHLQQLLAALEDPKPIESERRAFTVLLVEDNEFAMELFEYALRRFNDDNKGVALDVLQAKDVKEALLHLAHKPIDLAIVDHFLPGMTGCELVQQMRQDARISGIPILMVSVGGDDVRERAYNSGADLFLDKPVLHKQLISTIAKLLAWKNEQ